jgi:hypothetical protein
MDFHFYFKFKHYKKIVDADGLFYVCKMMETHHKKTFNYIIKIYFKILKTLNKVDDEFKD